MQYNDKIEAMRVANWIEKVVSSCQTGCPMKVKSIVAVRQTACKVAVGRGWGGLPTKN